MPRRFSPFRHVACAAVALVGFPASALSAQNPMPRWTIAGGFTSLRVGAREGWGYGPELSVRRDFGRHAGVQLRAALPAFSTNDDAGGGAIDLGPTVTFAGRGAEIGLSGGGTMFLLGDDSEIFDGGVGLFVGGHGTAWITKGFGIVAATNLRFTLGGGRAYPSLTAGIAVRF